jgi:RNA polymerase sigma-70 factor (ECF subfamily)
MEPVMTEPADPAETKIRNAIDAGHVDAAASATLDAYGQEILSLLASRLGGLNEAQEVYSLFAEEVWVGLPTFAWHCSVRTWCYALARQATARYARTPHKRFARRFRFAGLSVLSQLLDRFRSVTRVYQRMDVKERLQLLRERLDPEEQTLLVLRVDRGLAWRDLAIAMSGDPDLDEADISRESMRLRNMFDRVKAELRRMARRDGLFEADG